jgi:hypothetical protein
MDDSEYQMGNMIRFAGLAVNREADVGEATAHGTSRRDQAKGV